MLLIENLPVALEQAIVKMVRRKRTLLKGSKMADFTIEITADTVAWYAAIIATISVAVHIMNTLKDRSKIKIIFHKSWKILGEPNNSYVMLDIANTGRRPITITHVGFTTESEDILLKDSFIHGQREITEGKSTTYLAKDSELPYKELRKAIVIDATGRKHLKKVPHSWRKG